MRVPTEFVHNRFIVAVAATGMLLVAALAGAAGLQIDDKEPIFSPAKFHVDIGVILLVFVTGYAACAVALLYPLSHRAGKWVFLGIAVCLGAMIAIGLCNAHAFTEFYTLHGIGEHLGHRE
jgi:hypothetical protein